ncbi:MAG: gamma-glutamyl-gamma-aminobutyrate hydrolase family protein [Tannerellaceae bacterium]|jgi:microsomal dipeptidase-like Zn-dependent dipeptidase/gamma-glutamyl-gamma-aminobutyrate hydrolase PuuD|nr:gamma-glutamyl-gamma-aminobutyrate hydrolase family protein [Tannerellaceae bacterium]
MNPYTQQFSKANLLKTADHHSTNDAPPLIGISANHSDGQSCIKDIYVQSVLIAGGAPVLIPVITDIQALNAIVARLDGILFSGGGDLNPLIFGEEPVPELQDVDPFRDEYDLKLLHLAFERQIPILGICRGHQLINAAFGGTLYQDIHSQHNQPSLKHSQNMAREFPSHTVTLPVESRLRSIIQGDKLCVNSIHHQAVKDLAPGFIATAISPDGINEALEHPEYSILSVQWHPEGMAPKGNPQMLSIFRHLVQEATLFAEAKRIHREIVTIDMHTDVPMIYSGDFDISKRIGGTFNPPFTESKVNLPLMEAGMLDATFMAAYIPQKERTEDGYAASWKRTLKKLTQLARQEQINPAQVGIAKTAEDLLRLKKEGRKSIFLCVENGYAIGKDIERIAILKQAGVSYITLCHNGDNDICDSSAGNQEWNGLSPFGSEVVHEMNRQGIIIDVSHASEATVSAVLKESCAPIIASHSSARTLCNHRRNLNDEQIKAIAEKGGLICVCLYTSFIKENSGGTGSPEATLSEAIRHINHIVNLVGIDHVGIGSDFDGGGELIGCKSSNELINITVRLLKESYSQDALRKLWGGNLLRVMQTVQALAR